ncbi:PLP-dependent aminotransferase family protein [Vibrio sp. JC009]|uniref:aminotransferase-like domain-containing protein n=1 Tax=Vibrio sp. JC009 TaxID=2912314 RepID=UPI0023B15A5A|nr:PLP-dependent aminotransferase family protein [Vibrio sp. JC009]WED22070.1 PLP-dependent aminotransferase family protein [Vibrio sp. JC009]
MTIEKFALNDLDSSPKYKQIADLIEEKIASGELTSNDKLPTHRSLADQLNVTVGTVTRAYAEAERRGLVEARVGAGTFVVDSKRTYWVFDKTEERQPDECNFGFNIPPLIDRSDLLREAMEKVSHSPQALNQFMIYQKPEGIESHRVIMANWLQSKGIHLEAERLLFSSGGQHGVQMVLDAFTRAGDTIFVEKLTYPGLISLAKQKQLSLKGIEMDDEGITPEALDAACRQFQARFIYLTPTLQNPTTATMSLERRHAVLEICKKHDLYVIEDDVNGPLLEGAPPPLVNLEPEHVFHVGAVSKWLAPGLRVGYVQPPQKLYQRLSIALQNHSWMISPLLTAITCELMESGKAEQTLSAIRKEMEARLEKTLTMLGDCNPGYKEHCFHLWLPLPEQWRLTDFIEQAGRINVTVKSAELFTPPAGNVIPAVRLALSSPLNQTELETGLRKLKELLETDPISDFTL